VSTSIPPIPPASSNIFDQIYGGGSEDPAATFRPWDALSPTSILSGSPPGFLLTEHDSISAGPRANLRHFRLIEILGRGGTGEVWSAHDTELDRVIAIKRPLASGQLQNTKTQEGIVSLFQQEAHLSARLDHPNIVPIYSWGLDQTNRPLMAMKLVKGTNWEALICGDRHLSLRKRLKKHLGTLITVARTVAFAHSHGMIHRDLKPQQVMVGEFGETYLMDWGLAVKFATDDDIKKVRDQCAAIPPVTRDCLDRVPCPAGTPNYMAPEQTTIDPYGLGPWTDVFQLGGILYYLLTGFTPINGQDRNETILAAAQGVIIPPQDRKTNHVIPEELASLCMQALEPDYLQRTITATAFANTLETYLQSADVRELVDRYIQQATQLAQKPLEENHAEDYSRLEQRAQILRQARNLDPESPRVQTAHQNAVRELVGIAIDNGNYSAALHHARELDASSERSIFQQAVACAQERILAEKRKIRRTVISLLGGLATLVCLFVWNQIRAQSERIQSQQQRNIELKQSTEKLQAALDRADQQAALTNATLRLSQIEQYSSVMRMASTRLTDPELADPMVGAAVALQPQNLRHFEWSYVHGHLTPIDSASRDAFLPAITHMALAPDVGRVFLAHGRTITTLALDTLEPVSSAELRMPILKIHTSNNGATLVAVMEDGTASLLPSLVPGPEQPMVTARELPGKGYVDAMVTPEGSEVLLVQTSGTLARLNLATGRLDWLWTEPTGSYLRDLSLSENQQLLAMVHQRRLLLFDWPSGRLRQRMGNLDMGRGSRALFWKVDFSGDGRRLLTANTFGVNEWDISSTTPTLISSVRDNSARVIRALYDGPNRIHLVWDDRILSTLDRRPQGGWEKVKSRMGHQERTVQVLRLKDGRLLTHDGSQILLWSRREGTQQRVFHGHQGEARRAKFSPEAHRVASISQSSANLHIWKNDDWDVRDDQTTQVPLHTVSTDLNTAMDVDWSSSGHYIAVVGETTGTAVGKIFTYASETGPVPYREILLPEYMGPPYCNSVEFSADERHLYGITNQGMGWIWRDWNSQNARMTTVVLHRGIEGDSYRSFRPSPNGDWIATANWSGEVLILDALRPNDTLVRTLFHDRGVNEVRWSPDSSMLAAACFDGTVYIYNTRTWNILRKLVGHRGRLRDVAFSPDSRRLVSCGSDGLFLLWDIANGQSLLEIQAAQPYAWHAEFSLSGTQLLTCQGDSSVRVYKVNPWISPPLIASSP
jgi:serine/threonine protein kinase/WD40 repeat protein